MNKEIKGLLGEIIILVIIVIVTIPFFILFGSEKVLAREELGGYTKGIDVDVIQSTNTDKLIPMSDEEALHNLSGTVIKITNLDDKSANYDFVFKMNKVKYLNNYKIMFRGNVYSLNDLEYTEDMEYRYFVLDNFNISNKEQYVTFLLWLNDESDQLIYESVSYSFMMERNLYEL